MYSSIKLIITLTAAVAGAAVFWYAIRQSSRKKTSYQRKDLARRDERSQYSSLKTSEQQATSVNPLTRPSIETVVPPPKNRLESSTGHSAGNALASISDEEVDKEKSSHLNESCTPLETPCSQTTDALALTNSEGAGAILQEYPPQLANLGQRTAELESSIPLSDGPENIATLRDDAPGAATPLPRVPIEPEMQIFPASIVAGEQIDTPTYLQQADFRLAPELPHPDAAVVAPAGVEIRSDQAESNSGSFSTGHSMRLERNSEENKVPDTMEAEGIGDEPIPEAAQTAKADKVRRPPKYKPSIRIGEAKSTPARNSGINVESIGNDTRSFSVFLHILFDRRNRYRISLLPVRNDDLSENLSVVGPNGEESWSAAQDEWFGDIVPANLGMLLEQGAVWQSAQNREIRWVLSGREIYVLAQNSTISAFVSTSRLTLYEDHLVLVTKRLEEAARKSLIDAGCSDLIAIDGDRGVPSGWVLLRNVHPTTPLLHESEAGILNILRPVHEVEISFRGGIRLGHGNWLKGHPPRIRLKGATEELEVLIDGERATDDGNGNFQVFGWDEPRKHTVFCGGVTQSYALVDGLEEWSPFDAFIYHPGSSKAGPSVAICGPLVRNRDPEKTLLLSTTGNTCLLGRVPGQIVFSPPRYSISSKEFLAFADFPVIWTLPAAPLRSDRSTEAIRLVSPQKPSSPPRSLSKAARNRSLRWCYAILESSYKRLEVVPGTEDVQALWLEYKNAAYRLRKLLR